MPGNLLFQLADLIVLPGRHIEEEFLYRGQFGIFTDFNQLTVWHCEVGSRSGMPAVKSVIEQIYWVYPKLRWHISSGDD